jgi:putative SOS response-associated peptidase YedK
MCAAIEFNATPIYFKDAPELPVLCRDGSVRWIQWGCPYGSSDARAPQGACARIESILDGKWRKYHPRPVKIVCSAFMERDGKKAAHWFPVAAGQFIQGALIELAGDAERRSIVYVVTEPAAAEVARIHDRQPRLVARSSPDDGHE